MSNTGNFQKSLDPGWRLSRICCWASGMLLAQPLKGKQMMMFRMVQKWINPANLIEWLRVIPFHLCKGHSSHLVFAWLAVLLLPLIIEPSKQWILKLSKESEQFKDPILSLAFPRHKPPQQKAANQSYPSCSHINTATTSSLISSEICSGATTEMSWSQSQVSIQVWTFPTWYSIITYNIIYLCIYIYIHIINIYIYIYVYRIYIYITVLISYTAWSAWSRPGRSFRTRNEPFWSHLRSKIWKFQTYEDSAGFFGTEVSAFGIFCPHLCPQRLTCQAETAEKNQAEYLGIGIKGAYAAYRVLEEENCRNHLL